MMADNWACDARNIYPGTVYGSSQHSANLYLDDIQAQLAFLPAPLKLEYTLLPNALCEGCFAR